MIRTLIVGRCLERMKKELTVQYGGVRVQANAAIASL